MPVHRRVDKKGPYYQWGNHGKKYYYIPNNTRMRNIAKNKALQQGRAIKANSK
jgi:hypothetical protein